MAARRFGRITTALLLVAISGPASFTLAAEEAPAGLSRIIGKITDEGKQAVPNATVVAYHLQTGATFTSSPTGGTGRFEITGLQPGYYDLAVETPEGLFVSSQVVSVPPDGKAVARLRLAPGTGMPGARGDFPGSDRPPTGVAQMVKKSRVKGIAILSGAGAAAAIGLSGGSSGGGVQSPSAPPN